MSYYHLAFGITVQDPRHWKRQSGKRKGLIRSLIAAIAAARRIRRDTLYLQGLPDHLLDDIGVSRSDLSNAVKFGRGSAPVSKRRF